MRKPALAIAVALAIALALSYAYAGVFVYYPVSIAVSPTGNPVYFAAGGNAGKPDISGTITVSPGANGSSLSITIHPTYQYNYYYNLSLVLNSDSKVYYITLRVLSPLTLPPNSVARLLVYDASSGNKVADVNLLTTGDTQATAALPANGIWRIDIYVFIPEGVAVPAPSSASIQLIYTPESGAPTPPSVPP